MVLVNVEKTRVHRLDPWSSTSSLQTRGPSTASGPDFTDKYLNILFIPVLSLTYLRFNLKARPGATCQNSNMGLTFFVLL